MHILTFLISVILSFIPLSIYGQNAFVGGEYPIFTSRKVITLDGRWSFAYLGSNITDVTTLTPNGINTPYTVVVPSSFDLLPLPDKNNLQGIRGTVLYRTTVYTIPNSFARIRIGACGFYCRVFVDGVFVGDHGGNGYTAFWIGSIPPSNATLRTLEIIADNRFNLTTARLHSYANDWYQYGGLYRSVEYHTLGPADPATVSIQAVDVLITNVPQGKITSRIRLHDVTETSRLDLFHHEDENRNFYASRYRHQGSMELLRYVAGLPSWINVTVYFDDNVDTAQQYSQISVDSNGISIIPDILVPNPTVWDITTPKNTHTIHVQITGSSLGINPTVPTDTYIDRFGFRTFIPCVYPNTNFTRLCLNGNPVKLKGYGRHDTNPLVGHALNPMERLVDQLLMQELGSNFIRVGHYTQDRSFLSLADNLGILTATETIGWDSGSSTYKDPTWIAASLAAIEEHVNDTFNHPSTVMYMFMNEALSDDPTVCPVYTLLNNRIKELNVNGLTSYASDKQTGDVCVSASGVDVLGFNIYPGWYNLAQTVTGNIQYDIETNVEYVSTLLDTLATWMTANHPTIPFFVSEIGAGSIPGFIDQMKGMWTEIYAGRLVNAAAQFSVHDDRYAGIALWQLMDQRVYNVRNIQSRNKEGKEICVMNHQSNKCIEINNNSYETLVFLYSASIFYRLMPL